MTFRSQQMSQYQMIIPRQGAWDAVNQLGQINLAHVIDCSDPSNRPFFSQLKRCDEALLKIQYLIEGLKNANIPIQQYDETQTYFCEKLHQIWKKTAKKYGIEQMRLIDQFQGQVSQQWARFQDITARIDRLKQNKKLALEKIACFQIASSVFGATNLKDMNQAYYMNRMPMGDNGAVSGVSYMVGVVPPQAQVRLNRMIYRVSRGFACVKTMQNFRFKGLAQFTDIIALVIYPSSDSAVLENKLKRVMQTFCTNNFVLSEIQNVSTQLNKTAQDYQQVINLIAMNEKQLENFMKRVRKLQFIQNWRTYFWKQRYLYSILDKMEIRDQFFRVQIYVPQESAAKLSISLNQISPTPSLNQMPLGKPPTAFRTTQYTAIAQEITDTYGVPRYQQVNPTVFTVVTFPFFFGVMFGDIAHGGVLFALGLYLVFFDDSIRKTALKFFSPLRYMIVMMGFFAFYCGWVYNDFMAMNINVFGSCYDPPPRLSQEEEKFAQPKPIYPVSKQCIYPFGIDPVWGRAENQLVYINGLKMKLSVIIAVIHMTVGVCLKAANSIFFKKSLDLFFEFIPQFLLLVGLFGYMDFLIVFKWLKNWDQGLNRERQAPNIITTMMNIGLNVGQTSKDVNDGNTPMWGVKGDTSQDFIQLMILGLAFICIPWMLLPKPFIEISRLKRQSHNNPLENDQLNDDLEAQKKLLPSQQNMSASKKAEQHQSPSQIFVHQLIETIEFVLGTVSNTASYLRLWALSLAHSQLAKVFFQKTLAFGFGPEVYLSIPMLLLGFYALVWITFGILMCMDTMQCFLHSLRLHWVQFQNKFYKGDGYKYQPFSFSKQILDNKNKGSGL